MVARIAVGVGHLVVIGSDDWQWRCKSRLASWVLVKAGDHGFVAVKWKRNEYVRCDKRSGVEMGMTTEKRCT